MPYIPTTIEIEDTLATAREKFNTNFTDIQDELTFMVGEIINWIQTELTGGGEDALDGIDGLLLSDGMRALVIVGTNPADIYWYVVDEDASLEEDVPRVVVPDTNPGDKCWILAGRMRTVWEQAVAPTTTDDVLSGYRTGDSWLYDGKIWFCVDNTENAAVWRQALKIGSAADEAAAGDHSHGEEYMAVEDHTTLLHDGMDIDAGTLDGHEATAFEQVANRAQASGYASLNAQSKVVQEPASKGAASGVASLNASTKVVEDPANATATPTASKIPIADGSGKLAAGWGGAASTLATLNGDTKVVENPANATATPTANKLAIADESGTLNDWVVNAMGASYCPPNILYKDADEIYLSAGRYAKAGYRHKGQYKNTSGFGKYWDIAATVAANIGAAQYDGGTNSGYYKARVVSSWYSLFLMGSTENYVMALPYIRCDTVTWNDPTTDIAPADHADGTTANNSFVTADDDYNNYRLVNLTDNTYDGIVYTIADTVNSTPDLLKITGNKTSEIAAAGWLQMIPPAGTDFVYLGSVRFDGSGNLIGFVKNGWSTQWGSVVAVSAYLHASSNGNTECQAGICPAAMSVFGSSYAETGGTSGNSCGIGFVFANVSDSTIVQVEVNVRDTHAALDSHSMMLPFPDFILPMHTVVRNHFWRRPQDWSFVAAAAGEIKIQGYRE